MYNVIQKSTGNIIAKADTYAMAVKLAETFESMYGLCEVE